MGSEMTIRIKSCLIRISRGSVSTYGAVAQAAGLANGARQVVRVLHSSAESDKLPWHRILRKDGSIALPLGGGFELQKALLEDEGVEVSQAGKVDLARFGFDYSLAVTTSARRGARTSPQRKRNPR
ncbi:MAG: MGMT family protein [Spirochaetota bacterium]